MKELKIEKERKTEWVKVAGRVRAHTHTSWTPCVHIPQEQGR